jgi:flagellar hook-length control protein FliK
VISFGPEFAADLSAMDAAPSPAGGAAPFAAPDTDLFNALLGQMMGQSEAAFEAGADLKGNGDTLPEEDVEEPIDVDPTELLNPLFVEGAAPVAPPTPTMVWSIVAVPAGATAATPIDSPAPAIKTEAFTDLPADEWSPVETPESIEPALEARTPREEGAKAAVPGVKTIEVKADVPPASIPADLPQAEVVNENDSQARSEFAPQIADAINKDDRTSRSVKNDKAPVEPKIDTSGIRPVPFVAVERAYAGNDQGHSKSFDAPKEQAPFPSSAGQPASQPTSMPTFVVPSDGRSMLNMPAVVSRETVDIPATVARDIDTNVPAQIVQSIRLQAINGGGEAIIRLNPDYLGEVVVAVKVEQGTVTAALQAETPAVRQWVERNEPVLRQALAEQGLQLDKLTVAEKASETERDGDHEDAREDAREESPRQQPRRRRPQSDEATFEVTV